MMTQVSLAESATLALSQVVRPPEHLTDIAVSTKPTPLERQPLDPNQTVPITATG